MYWKTFLFRPRVLHFSATALQQKKAVPFPISMCISRPGASQPSCTAGAINNYIFVYLSHHAIESSLAGTHWGVLCAVSAYFRVAPQVVELFSVLQLAGLLVVALLPLAHSGLHSV